MKRFAEVFKVASSLVLTLLLVLGASLPATQVQASGTETPSTVLSDVSFTMDDGVVLKGSVFLPPATMKAPPKGYPMVVLIHGWGGNRNTFDYPTWATTMAQQGFVALTYDVRGFGESGGLATVAGNREIQDLHNLMKMMLLNTTSLTATVPIYDSTIKIDPSAIGTTGISYGGGHSYRAAASNYDPSTYVLPAGMIIQNPRTDLADPIQFPKVKAVAPIVGWSDLYNALYPNGTLKMSYSLGLSLLALGDSDPITYEWLTWSTTGVNKDQVKKDMAQRSILQDGAYTNPNFHENSIKEVPIFMIQSWEDYLFPVEQATTLYRLLQKDNPNLKLYLGNTGHAPSSLSTDTAEAHYIYQQIDHWFQYWLQGKRQFALFGDHRVEVAPEPGTYPTTVSVEDWATHLTHYSDLPSTQNLTFYLNQNQSLTSAAPTTTQLSDVIINNPANGIQDDPIVNGDTLVAQLTGTATQPTTTVPQPLPIKLGNAYYSTPPLTNDITVFGRPTFDLYAASNTTQVQLTTKVYDVDPAGNAVLTTRGINLFQPAFPGMPARVQVQPFSDYHRFAQGHRIVVEIAASDSPFFQPDGTTVETQLFHDQSLASKITWKVLQ